MLPLAVIASICPERHESRQALVESERRFRLLVEGRAKGLPARALAHCHARRQIRDRGLARAQGWRPILGVGGHRADPAESGKLLGYANITRDITERRSAQEALRESERQFRLLVGGIVDYAIFMLDPNGIVVSWNRGAEKIKGYTCDEIIAQHVSKFHGNADRSAGVPARLLYTAAQEGRFEGDGWRVRKDGNQFWTNVATDAIRDHTGQLIGFAKRKRGSKADTSRS